MFQRCFSCVSIRTCTSNESYSLSLHDALPISVFVTIWQMIEAIKLFDLVFTTTKGGPLDATKTIVYFVWESAFKGDRKSTRLNSSHVAISYAVFCLKKKRVTTG